MKNDSIFHNFTAIFVFYLSFKNIVEDWQSYVS